MEWKKFLVTVYAFAVGLTLVLYRTDSSNERVLRSTKPINEDSGARQLIKKRRSGVVSAHNDSTKIIYSWDGDYYVMDFTGCEYSNCETQHSDFPYDALYADVVIVDYHTARRTDLLQDFIKQNPITDTVWLLNGMESPGYSFNRWRDFFNDFDGAITYRRDALVYHPYGQSSQLTNKSQSKIDYAAKKTRGAFAYVSNCDSTQYNRLETMKELAQYIDVDIFGGCTDNIPCDRGDWACEHRLHSQYHFYLSFENSLCKDYVTEKFWKVLNGDGYYIPVALGGLTLEDYTAVAPPDSFLHVYNFTSIEKLGRYMKELTQDHQAFNRYNRWKNSCRIEMSLEQICKICEIANFPTKFKTKHSNIAKRFNDPKSCRGI